ncbi:ABC transporter permease [Salinarimonas rosea]|uniref:ABC transporter permease n=1 Tax=Salinarimonas rosea TaxID=552063 RepID=UPI000422CC73|nr:ABC transporter permease [Salinarimonas rosea]
MTKSPLRHLSRIPPIWMILIACVAFFSVFADSFFAIGNFTNILIQTSTIGLIALGMTVVMINGNIDLSVGAVVALAASLAVGLQADLGIVPAVLVGLGAGVALGFLNGMVVWKTGVDAFIVTLGAMMGVRGLVFLYTGEQSFFSMNFAYADFGMSSIAGVPTLAWVFLALTVIMHVVMTRTTHGRNAYAVGGNREAAENAGIRVGRHMVANFMLVGFFAALAGITLSTQMGASTPNLGTNYELWVITAVVLGGTKLTGGVGTILGTLGGVLTIGVLRNGMNLMQVPAFYVLVVMGAILIAVLLVDARVNRRVAGEVKL